jgi:hypothetical protein
VRQQPRLDVSSNGSACTSPIRITGNGSRLRARVFSYTQLRGTLRPGGEFFRRQEVGVIDSHARFLMPATLTSMDDWC